MASAYIQLLKIYHAMGCSIRIGLNPAHFSHGHAYLQYCYVFKDGKQLSTGAGISLQEVYFFECLFETFHPRHIFIVGNAFGWSTVLMALCNPQARVIAIDSGMEGSDAKAGITLTNEILRRNNLNGLVEFGSSPMDVPRAAATLGGPVDFAFVDGLHTNEQQLADFNAIHAIADPRCVYAFHDVLEWKMQDSFSKVGRLPGYISRMMLRTPSGMGLLYPMVGTKAIDEVVDAFCHDPSCTIPDSAFAGAALAPQGRLNVAVSSSI